MTDYTDNMNHRVSESPPLSSKSEWTSVLHLSHTWNFPSMRSLAVRQLLSLTTPVDRVVLGRKYDVEHWLRPAYQAICEREEWLSEQEGERLGLRDVLKIGRARQLLRAPAVLREEEERRSLLDGVFGDHPSSTTDDIPPSPLALASEDDPVQQSFATSSSAYTEHMDLSREIESLPALEVTAATTDTSVDTSSRRPADDHYKAALGPVYAPVTSSLRDLLLRAVSEINSAEEAMPKDQQTAAEEEANAEARYNVYPSDNNSRALDKAQDKLSRVQQVTTRLEGAYNSFVVIVSPYCPSLAKSYRITPEARKELALQPSRAQTLRFRQHSTSNTARRMRLSALVLTQRRARRRTKAACVALEARCTLRWLTHRSRNSRSRMPKTCSLAPTSLSPRFYRSCSPLLSRTRRLLQRRSDELYGPFMYTSFLRI
jgi:molecular chaperone GrpE (heat shock protein)